MAKNADLDIINEDRLAPVDYGTDSLSGPVRMYLKTIKSRSRRLDDW